MRSFNRPEGTDALRVSQDDEAVPGSAPPDATAAIARAPTAARTPRTTDVRRDTSDILPASRPCRKTHMPSNRAYELDAEACPARDSAKETETATNQEGG